MCVCVCVQLTVAHLIFQPMGGGGLCRGEGEVTQSKNVIHLLRARPTANYTSFFPTGLGAFPLKSLAKPGLIIFLTSLAAEEDYSGTLCSFTRRNVCLSDEALVKSPVRLKHDKTKVFIM